MIVTCEQCTTQFQLDDAKVPEGGIRVRCSRCRHAFQVESPNRSDFDRADELARNAFDTDSQDDVESDWQFNEELQPPDSAPSRAAGRDAAAAAVDDLLGAGFGASRGASGDLATDVGRGVPDAGPEPAALPPLAREQRLEPAPRLARERAVAEPALGGGSIEDPDFDGELTDAESFPEWGSLDGPAPLAAGASESAAAGGVPDRAGQAASEVEPADPVERPLDPADPGMREEEGTPEPTPSTRTAGVAIGRLPPSAAASAAQSPATSVPGVRRIDVSALEADFAGQPGNRWVARIRAGLAWALVCGLCAFAGLAGLAPAGSLGGAEALPPSIAGLDVHAIEGHWIENALAGRIYVVRGELWVGAQGSPQPGALLRVRLVDAAGRPIPTESAALGPPLSSAQLHEWKLSDLQDHQERASRRLARTPLARGEPRPVLAVLGLLPPAAKGYEITQGE